MSISTTVFILSGCGNKIFANNGMLLEGQAVFPPVDVDYEETLDMTTLLQENWSIELSC